MHWPLPKTLAFPRRHWPQDEQQEQTHGNFEKLDAQSVERMSNDVVAFWTIAIWPLERCVWHDTSFKLVSVTWTQICANRAESRSRSSGTTICVSEICMYPFLKAKPQASSAPYRHWVVRAVTNRRRDKPTGGAFHTDVSSFWAMVRRERLSKMPPQLSHRTDPRSPAT